jgi:hypothetical protein
MSIHVTLLPSTLCYQSEAPSFQLLKLDFTDFFSIFFSVTVSVCVVRKLKCASTSELNCCCRHYALYADGSTRHYRPVIILIAEPY